MPVFEKILIIATRQIGDVLVTTPLIRRARQIWPTATIHVLGYERTMGMLEGNPDIDLLIESSEHPKWPEYKTLIGQIFRKYDLAIVSQPSDRAHIYGLLAAPTRIGIIPEKLSHNWWKRLFSRHTVTLDYMRQHVVHERFKLLDLFDTTQERLPIVVPPKEMPLETTITNQLATDYVVIHATPMWQFKRWPISAWADLIKSLNQIGIQVVLTGSKSNQDQEINQEIVSYVISLAAQNRGLSASAGLLNFTGLLSLAQTGTLLRGARGFVGVDTSVTHLAAACGIPVVTIFGATPPTNYGPWPINFDRSQPWKLIGQGEWSAARTQTVSNVRIIQGPGKCVPCRKAGCLDKFESHSECLDQLPSAAVIAAVTNHLNLTPKRAMA